MSKMNTKYNVWAPPDFISGLSRYLMLSVFILLTGCDQSNAETSSAGNIGAINHVSGQDINWFSVNGYRAHGTGGGVCCVMIPDKWRPGLIAHIEWEVDPNADERIPMKKEGFEFEPEAIAKHVAKYRQYSADISIPKYDQSAGISVHFLPCHQVKVYAGESSYGASNYPIKEPTNMKEPATCPK